MFPGFESEIRAMNAMYELATVEASNATQVETRLQQFKKILIDEVNEINDIKVRLGQPSVEHLTQMADLLGDIIVYCASEAVRWNIPLAEVLKIIMQSNFSKLGADGKPIKNPVTDKFEKGPNYWKPEPKIRELLEWNSKNVEKRA